MAKILIVDDEKDCVQILQSRLESLGHDIDVCFDGGSALDRVVTSDYDLLILDYFMPSLKGDLVCKSLREIEKFKALPILIYTGFTEMKHSFFIEHGATDVLHKPADKETLIAKVEQLLLSQS